MKIHIIKILKMQTKLSYQQVSRETVWVEGVCHDQSDQLTAVTGPSSRVILTVVYQMEFIYQLHHNLSECFKWVSNRIFS